MFDVSGKYNSAKIFTDLVESEAISQIIELCNQKFCSDSKIRIMPDVHVGVGCTIGTTMTITDKIVPNLVGVDIGCGVTVNKIKDRKIDLGQLDNVIRKQIPCGTGIRKNHHKFVKYLDLEELKCIKHVNPLRAELSLGTLGGGNHFIEANIDDEGLNYIVIHSGSRHLGNEVARYYQDEAIKQVKALDFETELPRHLSYLSGSLFDNYIHDMKIVQHFAKLNRETMLEVITSEMKLKVIDEFSTIHNYIDTENSILRKGAVSANENELLLIPINMRDGSLLCIGKGNEDWNYSAPHGAGRLMSRSEAKESIKMEDFKASMKGIYTSCVSTSTIDESPFAYKPLDDIVSNIGDTVEILKQIKPIYNFKAS